MKTLFKLNLKAKLFTSFLCILIIPSIVIGLMSFQNAKKELELQLLSNANVNVKLLDSILNDTMKTKMSDVDYLAKVISQDIYEGTESPSVRKIFNQYLNLHEDVYNTYVGTKSGLTVIAPFTELPKDFDPRKREWYLGAMEKNGDVYFTNPYVDAANGEVVVTISQMTDDRSGVVAVDINLSSLSKLTKKVKIGEKGYAIILDQERKYIVHPTIKPGEEASDSDVGKVYEKKSGTFEYLLNKKEGQMFFTTNERTGWKIAGTMFTEEIDEAADPIFNKTLIIIGISLLIGFGMVFFIIRSITKPLKILSQSAIKISNGDLTEKIQIHSNDEIGTLTNSFNEMKESLRTLIKQVDESSEQVASSSEQLSASAEETTSATELVSSSIQQVASGAEIQNSMIETNVEALEEVSHGILRINENSMNVNELSVRTTQLAEEGGHLVKNTVEQMESIYQTVTESDIRIKSLYERSKEIDLILGVINDISDQTNLLALNAAIEAARAGEHGKGFSVVAAEVRKLSEQSSVSAKQISELIAGIQKDTEYSVAGMEMATSKVETGLESTKMTIEKFDHILGEIRKISPQVEEISVSAQQMASSIQEVSSYAIQIASIAKENAATSEEVASSTEEQLAVMEEITAASKSLSFMAEGLKDLVRKFKL